MKYNFWASPTQRRPYAIRRSSPAAYTVSQTHLHPSESSGTQVPLTFQGDVSPAPLKQVDDGGAPRLGVGGILSPAEPEGREQQQELHFALKLSGFFPATIYIPARSMVYKVNVHMSKYSGHKMLTHNLKGIINKA